MLLLCIMEKKQCGQGLLNFYFNDPIFGLVVKGVMIVVNHKVKTCFDAVIHNFFGSTK